MPGATEQLRRKLLKVICPDGNNDADMDEFNSVLLQLSLALMMIFMIAFFLFMSKVDMDISQVDTLKQQLADAEQAKILHAVEKAAEQYRIRYGLKEFMLIDPETGKKSFEFDGVVENGTLSRPGPMKDTFLTGASYAKKDYDDTAALEQEWIRLVNKTAGKSAEREKALVQSLVRDYVRRVRREVVEVQTLAAAAVQQHFVLHPDEVRDPEIRQLLARINAEPDSPERETHLTELSRKLKIYVYDHLAAQCGVRMLEVQP